ncbi:MAG: HAMP domain-containing sensor histidine kinase [Chitinophagaceae bacterium]
MRSATLKWIVLLSTLLVAVIIIVQLYWLDKVYSLEERQFNTNIVKSVRGLFEDMELVDSPGLELKNLIEHPNANTFLVQIDSIPRMDSLKYFLVNEFQDFGIMADCKLSVYDDDQKKYIYEEYLPTPASKHPLNSGKNYPAIQKNFSYISLYFPHREQYILAELTFWLVGAILLLITLVAFAASLFYLYRQKTLNEVQKDFVNNFTHEFRTPLAVMKLAADVLINPSIVKQPERLIKYSSIVKEQTEHLQHQVEKLLKTATSDNNKLQLQKELFTLNELVNDVLHQLDPMIREKEVTIELDLEDENNQIFADRSHIAMVLVNLLENAIKYSNRPHVVIKTAGLIDGFSISVKDNGVGIEKKYTKHLFKKFFRVPTGNVHNVKGFGLGLNFVKKVVDTHRGKIIVNSLPGIGTEFKILLPKQ